MKGNVLQKKVLILFSTLSISILLCFAFFYVNVLNNLIDSNKNYIEKVSESIISTMENTFFNIEHAAVTLANNPKVTNLLYEEDPLNYHSMAESLKDDLNSVYQPDGLVDDIIIYDTNSHYYRFRGDLGNASCDRIAVLLDQAEYQHLELNLTHGNYIGYVANIYDNNIKIGYIVFLIQTSELIELFENYDDTNAIQMALVANNNVIASNSHELDDMDIDKLKEKVDIYTTKKISYTDFEIIVTTENDYITQTQENFVFIMMIAIIAFLAIITLFYYFLNKTFFKPMITVIDNVKDVPSGVKEHRLDLTGQSDFDKLINEVNSMLEQLDDNARTMLDMQYKTQNALIEKQQLDIDFLKKQINIHFIVNTIAAIKRLNEIGDNQKSGEMCNALAHILRYANNAQDYINAVEELHILELYIDIMKMKYTNSIACIYDIDGEVDELMLPRMLLQPLIENAMVHGIALADEGTIIIKAQVIDTELIITVQDNGIGMSEEKLERIRLQIEQAKHQQFSEKGIEHIALINIQRRLAYTFGDAYGLALDSVKDQGTTVRINLPILRMEDFE